MTACRVSRELLQACRTRILKVFHMHPSISSIMHWEVGGSLALQSVIFNISHQFDDSESMWPQCLHHLREVVSFAWMMDSRFVDDFGLGAMYMAFSTSN